jgi:predicted N-acetyltransferase YhbS
MVGSVRLTPICIGETPALLLGPLTVEPPFRSHGVGTALVQRALAEAKVKAHRLVVLVGDEPIYAKSGFKRIPKGQVKMPGPVDPARLLVAELAAGAFKGVSGMIRPDWE